MKKRTFFFSNENSHVFVGFMLQNMFFFFYKSVALYVCQRDSLNLM